VINLAVWLMLLALIVFFALAVLDILVLSAGI